MRMALRHYLTCVIDDSALAQALVTIKHIDVGVYAPPFVLVLLTEEFDAFVDFNVLLATYVRGLEFVIRHELNC